MNPQKQKDTAIAIDTQKSNDKEAGLNEDVKPKRPRAKKKKGGVKKKKTWSDLELD